MKIAIFHNFLDNIGGAEMVTLSMARELGADIYTTNSNKEMIAKMGYTDITIHSIGKVPINAPFRQQLTLERFARLKLGNTYDRYIISGDWAISGAKHNKPNIYYVHSPIRELWDLNTYIRTHMVSRLKRPIFDAWVTFNRFRSRRYVEHVGTFICNSKNTQARLKKYLGKEGSVAYPPIDTRKFSYKEHQGYWLSVNRLTVQKRADIQMKAFAQMPKERLIMVGSYEQSGHFLEHVEYIKSLQPKNVELRSWVSDEEMKDLFAHAKGFITIARDEDFGITPIEAMASGKPVIATREGGYIESVLEGVTGTFMLEPTPKALVDAVRVIGENPEQYRDACLAQAATFDTKHFIAKIKEALDKVMLQ